MCVQKTPQKYDTVSWGGSGGIGKDEGSNEKDKLKIKESVMNGIFFGIFTKFLTFF